MKNRFARWLALSIVILFAGTNILAAPNLRSLVPFGKRVEANPNADYTLTVENGPWMVLATSFSGPGAEQQARELVMELRKEFNLEAYSHNRVFDFTEPVVGLGINMYGEPKKMRYRQNVKFEEIAVLVGNFETAEDEQLQTVLTKLKYARPDCLDLEKRKTSFQRFAGLREIQRRLSPDPEKRQRGPMGNAFVTRNPLLPKEYFVPQGLDPLVKQMNEGVEHSLLNCAGRYSVRVATFRGESTMNLQEMEEEQSKLFRGQATKLELAADRAHRLTVALRQKGIEAYEFHDRFESIVTIGSFNEIGTPRPDGKIEINPAIHAIIESYRATRRPLQGNLAGLQPRTLAGIPFDVQPVPVEVPRDSIIQQASLQR